MKEALTMTRSANLGEGVSKNILIPMPLFNLIEQARQKYCDSLSIQVDLQSFMRMQMKIASHVILKDPPSQVTIFDGIDKAMTKKTTPSKRKVSK